MSYNKGFTLIEILVGSAVFLIIAFGFYQAFLSLFLLTSLDQYKTLALDLANEEFEIVRNLSYSSVGELNGIPAGLVPHSQVQTRGGIAFTVITTIRNVDLPFDGTLGGTPNDTSPADNKLVQVEVDCATCKGYSPITLTTTIAPKNLETASTNGALFIKVFDANGIPLANANVHVVNSKVTPNIVVDDVTNTSGMLQIVDVPPGNNAYSVTVSKPGYSTARTYPPGGTYGGYTNTTPSQPDATVVLQQVTSVSLAIDKVSTLAISSVTPMCTPVAGIDFTLTGSKSAGTTNTGIIIPKYTQNLITNGSGLYSSSSVEWDAYNIVNIDGSYDIIGINPLNLVPVNPNSTQSVQLVVAPKNPKSLLVTVKDSSTLLPLTGVTVTVTGPGSYSSTQTTDRGYINQTDWSGGSGQDYPAFFTDQTKYATDDGGVSVSTPTGSLMLRKPFTTYSPTSGMLESSTIDTGSPSNFYNLVWAPTDQPIPTGPDSAKFQFATNLYDTASTTWNYEGPDGTSGTYYTTANTNISSDHNGDRYARYKVFLNTQTATSTPILSDIAFTFTSLCTPPGQVVFTGLASGTYQVTVSKTGYTTYQTNVSVSANWLEQQVILGP